MHFLNSHELTSWQLQLKAERKNNNGWPGELWGVQLFVQHVKFRAFFQTSMNDWFSEFLQNSLMQVHHPPAEDRLDLSWPSNVSAFKFLDASYFLLVRLNGTRAAEEPSINRKGKVWCAIRVAQMAFIDSASGSWLDWHASNMPWRLPELLSSAASNRFVATAPIQLASAAAS